MEIEELANELTDQEHLRIIHARNIGQLIRENQSFRYFLCHGTDMEKIGKEKLGKLLGPAELLRIEDEFPEILRIDVVTPFNLRIYYEKMLTEGERPQYGILFMRKTMAIILGILREIKNRFERQQSKKNSNLAEKFEQKMGEILQETYIDLYSAKKQCVLIKFVQYVEKEWGKMRENDLQKWKTKKCEREEEQRKTLDMYLAGDLGDRYKQEITGLLSTRLEREKFVEILDNRGAKTGIIEIIGQKRFLEMVEGGFLGIFPTNLFQDDSLLCEHYDSSIIQEDDVAYIRHKLSADILVFLRWLHRLLGNKMPMLWGRMHREFDLIYDGSARGNPLELANVFICTGRMFLETHKFVAAEIVAKGERTVEQYEEQLLMSVWSQLMVKAKRDAANMKKAEVEEGFERFMKDIHTEEFVGLLRRENKRYDQFMRKLLLVLSGSSATIITHFLKFFHPQKLLDALSSYDIHLTPVSEFKKLALELDPKIGNEKLENIEKAINTVRNEEEGDTVGKEQKMEDTVVNEENLEHLQEPTWMMEKVISCPDKNIPLQKYVELDNRNNQDPGIHALMLDLHAYLSTGETNAVQFIDTDHQCFQVEMHAVLWWYDQMVSQLARDLELDKSKVKELLSGRHGEIAHQICLTYHLFEYLVKTYERRLMRGIKQRTMLKLLLKDPFVTSNDMESIKEIGINTWINQKCADDDVISRVTVKITEPQNVKQINFLVFWFLLQNFQQFRHFFCNLSGKYPQELLPEDEKNKKIMIMENGQLSELGKAKKRVQNLVGDENLFLLEQGMPEVMQIDVMLLQTQLFLYRQLLGYKSDSAPANSYLCRIVIPLLLQKLKKSLGMAKKEIGQNDRELFGALETKSDQIIEETHRSLVKMEFRWWMGRTLCTLEQFRKYVDSAVVVYRADKKRITADTFRNWKDQCGNEEAELKAFEKVKMEFNDMHWTILKDEIKNNVNFRNFLKATPGAITRVGNLLIDDDQNLAEYKKAEDVRDMNVFTKSGLQQLYLDLLGTSLASTDAETRLMRVLALSFAVWIWWMDHELSPLDTKVAMGAKQVWADERLFYVCMYDGVYDANFAQLRTKMHFFREMVEGAWKFVEKSKQPPDQMDKFNNRLKALALRREIAMGGNNRQKKPLVVTKDLRMEKEWKELNNKAWDRAQELMANSEEVDPDAELVDLGPRVQTLHYNILLELVEERSMRDQMKMEMKYQEDNVQKWLLYFMEWELIEKILHLIKLTNDQFMTIMQNKKQNERKRMIKREESSEEKRILEENYKVMKEELDQQEEKNEKEIERIVEEIGGENSGEQRKTGKNRDEGKVGGNKKKTERKANDKEEAKNNGTELIEEEADQNKGKEGMVIGEADQKEYRKGKMTQEEKKDQKEVIENGEVTRKKTQKEIKSKKKLQEKQPPMEINTAKTNQNIIKNKRNRKENGQEVHEIIKNQKENKITGPKVEEAPGINDGVPIKKVKNGFKQTFIGQQKILEENIIEKDVKNLLKMRSAEWEETHKIEQNDPIEEAELEEAQSEAGSDLTELTPSVGSPDYPSSEKIGSSESDSAEDIDSVDEEVLKSLENVEVKEFLFGRTYFIANYENFLTNPTDAKRKLMDICGYLNEISRRFSVIKKGKNFDGNQKTAQKFEELFQNWLDLLKNFDIKSLANNFQRKAMEKSLHKMLKGIIFAIEEKIVPEMPKDQMAKEVANVKVQLHKNILAKAILFRYGAIGQIWTKMDENGRNQTLAIMYNRKDNAKSITRLAKRFKEHVEGWRKLVGQEKIDRRSMFLYINYLKNSKINDGPKNGVVEVIAPILAQQIYFKENDDGKHEKALDQLLQQNGYVSKEASAAALEELKKIVSQWSSDARLVESGSFLMGAHTSNSDIDTICLLPEKKNLEEEKLRFFGAFECKLKERQECGDNSLFCQLCKNGKTIFLRKLPHAYIPIIELRFAGIDFDMALVTIPDVNAIPESPNRTDVEGLMGKLISQPEPNEAMLKSLAGMVANAQMLELLGRKTLLEKFRQLLLIVKFWAKSNFIYGNIFGFLNGISLSVLLIKVILLYPNATMPFLLERFFLICISWNWPIPLKLVEYVPNEFEQFNWNPMAEELQKGGPIVMPVITPSCLEQNGTYNVNLSTFGIIQKSMREALEKVRQIRSSSNKLEKWQDLFPIKPFAEKYSHYFVVNCIVGSGYHAKQFCGFVERRIRIQLAHFDANTKGIKFSHVKAQKGQLSRKNLKCPKHIKDTFQQQFPKMLCRIWLVGIELENPNIKIDEGKLKEYINEKLANEFDKKIVNDYFVSLKGCYQKVELLSKYAEAIELKSLLSLI